MKPLKLIFYFLAIPVLFILLFNTEAFATFVVSPMEFHLSTANGETTTGSFWVRNRGTETIALKVYTGDFWIEPDGKEAFLEPGKVERSCSKWIEVAPEELELKPNESRSIRFNLTVPPAKTGTFWSMIFIEQTNKPTIKTAQKGQQQFNILSFQRVGVRIYQEVPDSKKGEGRITQVNVERGKKDEFLIVSLKVENNGNVLLKCKGSADIKDERGETVESAKLDEFNCYPHAARIVSGAFNTRLKPGQYTALAVIDYGAEYLVAGETVFKVNPITGSIDTAKTGQEIPMPQAAGGELKVTAAKKEAAPAIEKKIEKIEKNQRPAASSENKFMASIKDAWAKISQAFKNLFKPRK